MAHQNAARVSERSDKKRRRWLIVLILLLISSWILYTSSPIIARRAGLFLDIGSPLTEPVDFVFILGGGANDRPFVAAEIYKAGFAEQLLIASPDKLPDALEGSPSEGDLVEGILVSENIPPTKLNQLKLSEISTKGEILALRVYLIDHPLEKGAIVTHNYHTRRARLLVHSLIPAESSSRILYVSCPTDDYSPENWWKYEAGLRTYWLEYVKYMAALLGM